MALTFTGTSDRMRKTDEFVRDVWAVRVTNRMRCCNDALGLVSGPLHLSMQFAIGKEGALRREPTRLSGRAQEQRACQLVFVPGLQ